jgi:transposase InsO family protein
MIHTCHECQVNQGKPQLEPLQPFPFPLGPWLELSGDFFDAMMDGSHWLVIIDDYSRYPFVKEVLATSGDVIIPVIEDLFAMMGFPDVLRTDNGAPFHSYKFSQFANRLGFKHRGITPYWPRANGEAERFMRNLNKVIQNAAINGRSKQHELQLFLRAYRATFNRVTKIAPNDLLFGFNRT